MSRKCQITGKGPLVGNKVSHSNRKSKKRTLPNLQSKRVWDEEKGRWVRLRLSTSAMRSLDAVGGRLRALQR